MMSNEPDTPSEHEQRGERTDANVLVGFLTGEGAQVAKQIDEADSDASVDVQDQLRMVEKSARAHEAKTKIHAGDSQYPSSQS